MFALRRLRIRFRRASRALRTSSSRRLLAFFSSVGLIARTRASISAHSRSVLRVLISCTVVITVPLSFRYYLPAGYNGIVSNPCLARYRGETVDLGVSTNPGTFFDFCSVVHPGTFADNGIVRNTRTIEYARIIIYPARSCMGQILGGLNKSPFVPLFHISKRYRSTNAIQFLITDSFNLIGQNIFPSRFLHPPFSRPSNGPSL
nr:MAG TPA: hypothetical protein [Caudoviricetes sp.]